jgi:hypothetical protein
MRFSIASRIALSALALSLVFVSGCMSTMGPKMPSALTAPPTGRYSKTEFIKQVGEYREAVEANNLQKALSKRNEIAYQVMADIEYSYAGFEMKLTTQRAGFETGSDTVQLGLAAAASVIGAGDVQDILAASLLGFQGTRLSVDKNFFREKTTESIISQMRASRKTKQAQLITSLANRDVTNYPWDAVWIDLIDFYYAGTVPSALVEIASSTGTKAEAASADLNATIEQQAKQAISVRSAYQKLSAAVNGSDKGKAASARAALKFILAEIGKKIPDNATADELLAEFRDAMSEADFDHDPTWKKLKALNAAIAAANI